MSNQSTNKLLQIATLGKAVGLRGEMKLHIKSDFPEQFVSGATFFINPKQSVTIESVNFDRGLVKLEGVNTPEDAKRLTNKHLHTTYEQTRESCNLDEGQFFWFDIVGCEVIEDGKTLGVVKEIERIGIVDYLSVKTADEFVEKSLPKSFLVPYHEPFVVQTDIDKKHIEVAGGIDILEAS